MARSHAFTVALMVSVLFHLSMVSVFSIVIRFPSKGVRYAAIEIAQEPMVVAHAAPRVLLRAPTPGQLLEEQGLEAIDTGAPEDTVPAIELPRLRAAPVQPLRSHEESLRIRSQFSGLFETRPQETPDSWALFTQELRGIGFTLRRWTMPQTPEAKPLRLRVTTPVPGIAVFVEWMSEPKDRKVLLSPPIAALWRLDPAQLAEPLALVLTVNAQGKVTDVQAPMEDEAGTVAEIKQGLSKYVFEPRGMEETKDQHATVRVTGESSSE